MSLANSSTRREARRGRQLRQRLDHQSSRDRGRRGGASVDAADERFLDQVQVRHDHDQLRLSFPHAVVPDYTRPIFGSACRTAWTYAIKTGSADISISADIGRSKIVSGSGDITVGERYDLDCSTGSGDISVARVAGRGARLSSGSGDLPSARRTARLPAKSGSGDVVVKSVHQAGSLQANSGSGDIAVSSTSGSVDLRSASGSLTDRRRRQPARLA